MDRDDDPMISVTVIFSAYVGGHERYLGHRGDYRGGITLAELVPLLHEHQDVRDVNKTYATLDVRMNGAGMRREINAKRPEDRTPLEMRMLDMSATISECVNSVGRVHLELMQ